LLTVPFGCDAATKRQEADNDAFKKQQEDLQDNPEDADDINKAYANTMVEYDVANAPTDFWIISVSVNVEDDGDVEDKFDVEDDAAQVGLSVCRVNDHPRERDNAYLPDIDCFVPEQGEVDITSFEKGPEIAFTAEVDLVESDDVDRGVGDVTIEGKASYCETLEDAVDDRQQIIEDLQE
jgi:hypothetical protein